VPAIPCHSRLLAQLQRHTFKETDALRGVLRGKQVVQSMLFFT